MLTKTAEYALRIVVFLAGNDNSVRTRRAVATATGVPLAYLTKVFSSLEGAGLVMTKRGPGGGYQLAAAPESISTYDVITAVSELPRVQDCPLGISSHVRLCPLHARLDEVAKLTEEAYRQTSIAELLPQPRSTGCIFPRLEIQD
ncbi:MAG: Rrf2 family transcriptional regulator [Pirellulaceae bacterium]